MCLGLIPGQETKILQAVKQKERKKKNISLSLSLSLQALKSHVFLGHLLFPYLQLPRSLCLSLSLFSR